MITNTIKSEKEAIKPTNSVEPNEVAVRKKLKFELFLGDVGNATKFVMTVARNTFGKEFEFNQFLKQCFAIGNQSLGLISITGIIIGLVLVKFRS